jgi:hypothetical protein
MSEQTTPPKPLTLHRLREMPTLAQMVTQTAHDTRHRHRCERGLQWPGVGATRHAGRKSRQTPPLCGNFMDGSASVQCAMQRYVEDVKASRFPVENIHTC